MPTPLTIPNTPSNLKAVPGSYITDKEAYITLTWTDNSDNEAEFRYYRQSPDGMWSYKGRAAMMNGVRSTDIVYASGLYAYKIQACNTLGCSAFSAVATVNIALLTQPPAPTPTPATSTLSVSLTANPSSGNAPLSGVDLTAVVSGTAQGTVNYTFYCNRFDSDTNIISGYAAKYDGSTEFIKTAIDICSYSTAGTYGAKIIVEKGGLVAESRATITVRQPLAPPVTVLSPNGGETFTQGKDNKVSWGGGRNKVQVGLVEPDYDSKTSAVLGWINANAQPASSLLWDAQGLTDLTGATKWSALPGSYKILVVSENASGGYCTWSESEACNTDLSDSPFQIVSAPVDAALKILTVDSSAKPVAGAEVRIFDKGSGKAFSGATASDGSFNIKLIAGTYSVEAYAPAGREDLIKPAVLDFSLTGGESREIKLVFGLSVKIISGTVAFTNKTPIADAQVEAYNSATGQWISVTTDAAGNYSMKVGSGEWMVGIRPVDPVAAKWRSPRQYQYLEFRNDAASETKTANFVVPSADAKIIVRVTDQGGNPLADVSVVLDSWGAAQPQTPNQPTVPAEFRKSDSAGIVTFLALPGKYYLRAFASTDLGLVSPPEQSLQVTAHETKEVNLVFAKREVVTSATINGIVKLDNGAPIDASIWAWSDKGGSAQGKAGADGKFSLLVARDEKWRVGAGKEINNFPHKSSEVTVYTADPVMWAELTLTKVGVAPLSRPVEISESALRPIVAQTQDGAKMVMPSGAAASKGMVNISFKPTVDAPSQAAAKVVGTVYDIAIKDQAGKEVKQLQQEIEIVLPYKEEDLKAFQTTEDKLVPSYFDESTGGWIKLDNYTIDKEKKVVIARVKHLTRFALVAPADIVPPPAPSAVTAKAPGGGSILLSWVNPTADFHHVKIYRSTKAGDMGSVVFADVSKSAQEDKGLKDNVTYYYTLRSVDAAGNESTNVNQVSTTPTGTTPAFIGQFNKNLFFGMTNDSDVTALQESLTKLGMYSGPVTGNFFWLTKTAVMNFQSVYAAEVLKPAGFDKPTGYVGTFTRAKLNQLAAPSVAVTPPTKPVTAVSKQVRQITRTLSYGLKNDEEVKLLQEWLTKLGVYSGPITGNFLTATEQAVAMFQAQYGLPVAGSVGPETQAELNKLFTE